MVVRGIDLLGHEFEEKTSTLSFNLHGCRYSSRYQLPKNTWVTLEIPQSSSGRHIRARVAWIQRPHSTRDYFQVAVELESPANIWEMDFVTIEDATADSFTSETAAAQQEDSETPREPESSGGLVYEVQEMSLSPGELREKTMIDRPDALPDPAFDSPLGFSSPVEENPRLRDLITELQRRAKEAVEGVAAESAERIHATLDEIDRKRQET